LDSKYWRRGEMEIKAGELNEPSDIRNCRHMKYIFWNMETTEYQYLI